MNQLHIAQQTASLLTTNRRDLENAVGPDNSMAMPKMGTTVRGRHTGGLGSWARRARGLVAVVGCSAVWAATGALPIQAQELKFSDSAPEGRIELPAMAGLPIPQIQPTAGSVGETVPPGTPEPVGFSGTDIQNVLKRLDAAEGELAQLRKQMAKRAAGEMTGDNANSSTQTSSMQNGQRVPEVNPLAGGGSGGNSGNNDILQNNTGPTVGANSTSARMDDIPDEFIEARTNNSGRPSIRVRGRIMGDTFFFSQSPANKAAVGTAPDGFAWRQARFGVAGEAYDNIFYQVEMDFGGGVAFKSTYLGVTDIPVLGTVMVGFLKEPFSLEEMPTEENLLFMERSVAGQAFVAGRRTGARFLNASDNRRFTYSGGVFFTDKSDDYGDDVNQNLGSTAVGRMTWLPYYDEPSNGRYYWHLGMGAMFSRPWQGQVSYSARPEVDGYPTNQNGVPVNSVPNFVKTKTFAAQATDTIGLETAWVHNSFTFQSEFMMARNDRNVGQGGDVTFWGGYVEAGYFLTGEYRPYDRFQGFLTRVYPNERFFSADIRKKPRRIVWGSGALEVATRLSTVNLNSRDIQGGQLSDITAAVSWFWNPHTRWEFNYIHAFLTPGNSNMTNGADIFLTRFIQSF